MIAFFRMLILPLVTCLGSHAQEKATDDIPMPTYFRFLALLGFKIFCAEQVATGTPPPISLSHRLAHNMLIAICHSVTVIPADEKLNVAHFNKDLIFL